jgi:hypothetical protein
MKAKSALGQTVMGWTNSHLHQFRLGGPFNSEAFDIIKVNA